MHASVDDGQTWEQRGGSSESPHALAVTTAADVFAAVEGAVLVSRDAGRSFAICMGSSGEGYASNTVWTSGCPARSAGLESRSPLDSTKRKVDDMCASCGCGQPSDNHGDSRNITVDDVDKAAQAAGVSREEAAENIRSCCSS